MTDEKRRNILAILNLLSRSRPRVGKTALQKTIYLLQEICGNSLGFRFVMYHYGPYSFELSEFVNDLAIRGEITIAPNEEGFGYQLLANSNEEGAMSVLPAGQTRLVEELGRQPVRELELLATTHFVQAILADRHPDGISDDELAQQVIALIRFHGRRGMVGANLVFAPSGRSQGSPLQHLAIFMVEQYKTQVLSG